MKKVKKQMISCFLIAVLVFSTFAFSFALPQDAAGHWAEEKISYYLDKGVITGYGDGSFRPDNHITRAEFLTVINKFFFLTEPTEISFVDVPANAWYKLQIQIAVKEGYITGYSDGSIKPESFITRQEAASIIAKLLSLADSGNTAEVDQFKDGKEIDRKSVV